MMRKGVVMRIWAGLIALLACAWIQAADEKVNLLRSPASLGSWSIEQHEQAAAEGQATSDGIRITVTKPGAESWHVQVYQANLDLAEGADYTIRFRAKSDAPRQYQCMVGTGVPDYHSVSPTFAFDTTTAWKEFSFPFKATNVVEGASRGPLFPLGLQPGTLELADIAIVGPRAQAIAFVMPTGYFEAPMHWDDTSSGTATDVSFLNAKPAGTNGYIVARDGHFYEQNTGNRVRFLGMNLGAGEAFPEKADAELFAKRLAKAGINIVRLHHMDNTWSIGSGNSIWDPSSAGRQHLSATQLDKLDYLIYQLKLNGIYSNINLKVSKELTPADGMPESITKLGSKFPMQKRVDMFQKRMIELQQDYARKLLTHKNPYTGMTYTQDPAIAVIEINNENSLVGYWTTTLGKDLDTLPEPFRSELQTMWNQWLQKRYGSDAQLQDAWMRDVTPPGPSLLTASSTPTGENHDQTKVTVATSPGQPDAAPNAEIDVQAIDATDWHVQVYFPGLTLREGSLHTITFRAKADENRKISASVGQDIDDWHNMGFAQSIDLGTEFKQYSYSFKATNTTPAHARLSFTVGGGLGKIWIEDLQLTSGAKGVGLQPGASLAKANIAFPGIASDRQAADWIAFLVDTERSYADQMRAVLKDELKAHANLSVTQIDFGGITGLHREAKMEYTDSHTYWQHPIFPGDDWSPINWRIENTPQVAAMADRSFGVLGDLAMTRIAGKPFSVSEYDHPAPSDYAGEMMPTYATFAALQDWDMIYAFAAAEYSSKAQPDRILGYFDQNNHPAKWLQNPTAALVFRQGLIAPAPAVATIQLPAPIWSSYHFATQAWNALVPTGPIGFLTRRLEISDQPLPAGSQPQVIEQGTPAPTQVRLTKVGDNADKQVYLAGAPSTAVFCGYIGGQTLQAGDVQLTTGTFGNNFATITATATDSQPLASSRRILVTVVGRVENKAMGWNAQRNSVGAKWGFGPPIAEYVPAMLGLPADGPRKAYMLDSTGKRVKQIPAWVANGKLTLSPSMENASLLYEIAAE